MTTLPVTALVAHPRNAAIYGDAGGPCFLEEVRKSGWVKPLVVVKVNGSRYRVVSGHRRWRAAKALGMKTVPVEVRSFDSPEAELETLLLENSHRDKTLEQKVREAAVWEELEKAKARARMAAGGRGGLTEEGVVPGATPSDRGKSRNAVAERTGLGSGKTYERARTVVKAIDHAEKAGNPTEAKALRKVLETEGAKPAARLLKLPPAQREKATAILAKSDTTSKQAVAKAKRAAIKEKAEAEVKAGPVPGKVHDLKKVLGRYRCVYIDPPWEYRDSGCRGAAGQHYDTMTIEQIEALPVGKLLRADGAHLWCWTTWPKIREGWAHRVMRAWGFDGWTSEIVWDKDTFPAGHYVRVQTEPLLLATTSPSFPLLRRNVRGLHREKPTNAKGGRPEFSEKPAFFRDLIETLSPGPRIELFSRGGHEGWEVWGDEA